MASVQDFPVYEFMHMMDLGFATNSQSHAAAASHKTHVEIINHDIAVSKCKQSKRYTF